MAVFALILCIVGAVVLSSFISRFIAKISTPLVQIALGALATQLPFFPKVHLDPQLFMVLFIAPLLYLEAHEIDKPSLLRSLRVSLSLAIGLALATMLAVGFALPYVWPAVSLAAAMALGAALGPTDAVAVSSLSNDAALTVRQRGVLQGESLFNDASGIVGFQFAILAASTGTFAVGHAAGEFLLSFVGGAAVGIAAGLGTNWMFETFRSMGWETTTTRILMELFLPFLVYLGAEDIAHVSGILSVVACGLFTRFDKTGIGPNVARTNIVSTSVWAVLSFSLNGSVFILLGMQLPDTVRASWNGSPQNNTMLLGIILLVSLVVIAMRFLWVTLMLRFTKDQKTHRLRRMNAQRWRSAAIMTFGGPKGTITLSLMFTIPYVVNSGDPFPVRDELVFIASGVIIVTLLLANFVLPILAPNDKADTSTELGEITIDILRQTVEELTGRVTPDNRRAVLRVIGSYTKRISRLNQRIGEFDPQGLEQLQIEALHWEKDYIKERLTQAKANTTCGKGERELQIEACERLLDHIMTTLRHAAGSGSNGPTVSQIRGRLRAMERSVTIIARRISSKVLRTAPLVSEKEIYSYMRRVQLGAIEHVIDRLYEEMGGGTYNTEQCSTLLLDYRRAESSMRTRPTIGATTEAIEQTEEAKREGYAIELGIIQDMLVNGNITRPQAKQLRRNVHVMQVDANSDV
ncbi:MAG: sodium:proton antiporter [Bifidobacterium sp.]|nr:sodium:proton antiporter [Bifidobacterium sp.]MCI1865210.1 sodium:proton antiporter [Bifidobacterium sp.]